MTEIGIQQEGTATDGGNDIDRSIGRRRSDRIVGAARATREVVDQAMAAAHGDLPVLITGPEGSGKQHAARAIHAWSDRAKQPFIVIACASTPEAALGREIFGSADADAGRAENAGALSRAGGGTLLLDRIDRLPASLCQSLQAAIKTRTFRREGESASRPLAARILVTSVEQARTSPLGESPQLTIRVAPLSERPEDVLPLSAHFLRLYADEESLEPVGFTRDARDALLAAEWPGNVRELAERIRQAIKLAGSGSISAEALVLASEGEEIPSFKEAKRAFETRYVVGLLRRCGGNISRAARLAKKDRKDFYDVIRRTGVNPSEFR
ncbi:MAG: sigma-54-dependent Fis family transcriptional regulator [Deltaproteobacteria bacterium]|nr:sigma-54-dependent Fis family transcriptional regulator [Deltaproteobacteria bacterium]MBW2397818.1 sigma-54-dependent Fis family transcriptional regulator [Deltaproteobacteria bacterium]MBW2664856.1 sigma-54-dependent Fis family transcriptional regulator [Deltaproteobacteria bacterium]